MGPREAWRVGALHDPEIWSDQAGGDWPVVKVPAQSQNRLATAVGTRVLDGSTGGASTPLVEPEARPRARRSKSSNNTSAVGGIAPGQSNIPRDHDAAGVVFLSTEGKIEFASRAAAELLGRALPDLMDRDLSTSIHPEDKQRVADLLSALVAEPGVTATMGFRCRNADGSWRWLGCAATNQLERPGI